MFRTAILAIVLTLNCRTSIAASVENVIDAFKKNGPVQAEIKRVRSIVGGDHEETETVSLGGSCGVVGCYTHTLVVMRISRKGTNPQTGTVLARVDELNGKIIRITPVELSPKTGAVNFKPQQRFSSHGGMP
jgi:hypothetical protein